MFEGIKSFRQRLKDGDILSGGGVYASDPRVTDALADSVDFFWLELEHNAAGLDTINNHLIVARAKGKPALVRLPRIDSELYKPILDAGADGIIIPQVKTPDDVRRIVSECRYAPEGERGFGPLVGMNYGRENLNTYIREANANIFITFVLETVEAVESIEEIVRIPGLDSFVIGPMDLSQSLGKIGDIDHPDVVAAMEKVIEAAKNVGMPVGSGMGMDPEFAFKQVERGVQWLQVGCDLAYMIESVDRFNAEIRNRLT